MDIFNKAIVFLREVRIEMKKVNWPTRQDTLNYTLLVVGISAAAAIFLGGIDFILTTLLNKFIL